MGCRNIGNVSQSVGTDACFSHHAFAKAGDIGGADYQPMGGLLIALAVCSFVFFYRVRNRATTCRTGNRGLRIAQIGNYHPVCPQMPVDAGIESAASGWHSFTILAGVAVAVVVALFVLPLLLPIVILSTALEASRAALGLDVRVADLGAESTPNETDKPALVLPGTCTYVFWQMGMMQYICEQFDTKQAQLLGVSSGAICSCFALALEEAADSGDPSTAYTRVRSRAQQVFARLDEESCKMTCWPWGFIGRLGSVIDAVADEVVPRDCIARSAGRIRVGLRRLTGTWLPALLPDALQDFKDRQELIEAVKASSHVGLMVRPTPMAYVAAIDSYCSDGVNPFSFYCFIEYWLQCSNGLTPWTAPSHTFSRLDTIYALWNCGVMKVLLPPSGSHMWVTPTVRNRLDVCNALRVSSWFIAEQWRQGYAHARELDADGYWNAMPRRA